MVLASLLIVGCEGVNISEVSDEDLERISEKAVVCNEPYIRFGTSCCLDQNGDGICDKDEQQITEIEAQKEIECPVGEASIYSPIKNELVCVPEEQIIVNDDDFCKDGKIVVEEVEGGTFTKCIREEEGYEETVETQSKEFQVKIISVTNYMFDAGPGSNEGNWIEYSVTPLSYYFNPDECSAFMAIDRTNRYDLKFYPVHRTAPKRFMIFRCEKGECIEDMFLDEHEYYVKVSCGDYSSSYETNIDILRTDKSIHLFDGAAE